MSIRDRLRQFSGNLLNRAGSIIDGNVIEGMGAAFAIVAMANGEIKASEQQSILNSIQGCQIVSSHLTKVIEAFEKHLDSVKGGPLGKAKAMAAIGKVEKGSDEANLIVAACCDIAAADGDFDPDERKEVLAICQELGVNESLFGLDDDVVQTPSAPSSPVQQTTDPQPVVQSRGQQRTVVETDFHATLTLVGGQEGNLPVKDLLLKLIWGASADLKMVAFFKGKDGRSGVIMPASMPAGDPGRIDIFPFIQLSISTDNTVEEMRIASADDLVEVNICAVNSDRKDVNFAELNCGVVISEKSDSIAIKFESTRVGNVAVICKIDNSSPICAKVVNVNQTYDLEALRQSISGAEGFLL